MPKKKKSEKFNKGEVVIYKPAKGEVELRVRLEGEMVWLSLNQIAELFGRDKSVISRHLRNVFKENELSKDSVVAKIATTAADGKIYQVEFYSLDAIISVGYRVNSQRATQFRIWATALIRVDPQFLALKSPFGGDFGRACLAEAVKINAKNIKK